MKGPSHNTLKSHRNHQKLKMVQIESLRMREKNQKGEGKWRRESKRGDGSGGWEARENGEVPLSYRGEGWKGENEEKGREGPGEMSWDNSSVGGGRGHSGLLEACCPTPVPPERPSYGP